MKLGLTGSIACGKSTVSTYLASLGCTIVDADAISRALTADGGAADVAPEDGAAALPGADMQVVEG